MNTLLTKNPKDPNPLKGLEWPADVTIWSIGVPQLTKCVQSKAYPAQDLCVTNTNHQI